MQKVDLVIIGAGPAGMAAAFTAAEAGLRVTILDEQPRAGGQIYRDIDRATARRSAILGKDFTYGKTLTKGLHHAEITHVTGAVVWAIEDGFRIAYSRNGKAAQITADQIILATGALERAMPLTGWTLPGVMTAGAGQILLKQSGIVARRAVLVGSGPLLYLIAAQMVRAGTPPLAMVETQTRTDMIRGVRHLGGALRGWRYLAKGAALLGQIVRAGVPRYAGATDITISGQRKAESVTFQHRGKTHTIPCDTVLLHHGVVPNTQTARSIDIAHHWEDVQKCFAPQVDAWGATSKTGVFIAGDGAGIGGAKVAEIAGRITALNVVHSVGKLSQADRDRQAAPLFSAKARELAVRPFLDTAYPPFAPALLPADDTIICRCEEVTAGAIRGYAKIGCLGPNQTKAFGRAGMGPCQGRYCGLAVTALLADANGRTPDDTGYYRIRAPLKPVTLGELASMDTDAADAVE
ncbi:MAG: NAD(P)/FAD-dependent oxidoreductase [Sulfitobacter sp.]|nr:NAD(P)/FAD-dependent oxidoreductase [Sulfitobacter sp.]